MCHRPSQYEALMFAPTPERQPITDETLAEMSRHLLNGHVLPADLAPVASLLNGLMADMATFHRVQLGELEPALVYLPEKEN